MESFSIFELSREWISFLIHFESLNISQQASLSRYTAWSMNSWNLRAYLVKFRLRIGNASGLIPGVLNCAYTSNCAKLDLLTNSNLSTYEHEPKKAKSSPCCRKMGSSDTLENTVYGGVKVGLKFPPGIEGTVGTRYTNFQKEPDFNWHITTGSGPVEFNW